jgi:hypothetical protein
MFVSLRRQGFESSVNKVFQKEKLINSKAMEKIYSPLKEVSSAGANLVQQCYIILDRKELMGKTLAS